MTQTNPTDRVDIDFPGYASLRSRQRSRHLVNGTPDYSFSLDNQLRRKLSAIGPLRAVARCITRSHEPFMQQLNMMRAIAVGPDQLPEVFEMGQDCARLLGIGVPRIFIEPAELPNAYTYACDDVKPSIVITTRLFRALAPDELKAIIGHECGHIHNLHSVYNTMVVLMANAGAKTVFSEAAARGVPIPLLRQINWACQAGVRLFMSRWSRCAEVTSDRAGAICVGSVEPMIRALVKLATRGEVELAGLDINAYVRQIESVKGSLLRLTELTHSHPLIPKRIEALRHFHNSEAMLAWRPESRTDGPVRSAAEVDAACESLISVTSSKH